MGVRVAVSIPDDLLAQVKRLAHGSKKKRRQIFTEALRDYVARHDPDTVTRTLDEVVDEVESGDAFLAAASRGAFERSEW